MVEVFDEKLVDECLSEVADSDIKTYAYCLLDWAVQKRKVQAIPLDKVKQAREEIDDLYRYFDNDYFTSDGEPMFKCKEVLEILDKLIESEE